MTGLGRSDNLELLPLTTGIQVPELSEFISSHTSRVDSGSRALVGWLGKDGGVHPGVRKGDVSLSSYVTVEFEVLSCQV